MGGLLAIVSSEDCSKYVRRGLIASRHQGNDYFGIAAFGLDGKLIGPRHQEGPAGSDFFTDKFREVSGDVVLGSVSSSDKEPIVGTYQGGEFALAINGRVLNLDNLKKELLGSSFEPAGFSHAQVVANLIGQKEDLVEGIKYAWEKTEGVQDIVILHDQDLIAARHPDAVLPLLIGESPIGSAVGSSDFVLRKLGFDKLTPLEGGDIYLVKFDDDCKLLREGENGARTCAFLWTYTGHIDDKIDGLYTAELRERLGRNLFKNDDYVKGLIKEGKIKPEDVVVSPILMSGLGSSIGYYKQALEKGFNFGFAPVFIPSQRYKRSYVPETNEERKAVAAFKLDEIRYYIEGKFVIAVDDSIVRGTQTEARMSIIKKYKPLGVVVRASHPKIWNPCTYQLSTRNPEELAAVRHGSGSDEDLAKAIGIDNVMYNSFEDYKNSFGELKDKLCMDCAKPK
ncbi:MAG: hypothetical protein KAT77_03275 [Nanoarchaeota archaeon]|nr:hypothetical protein [Nanoarchaeota archaeon]